MKVLIIDDEEKARNVLEIILEEKVNVVKEIYQAADLESGVKLIKEKSPDLVMLDIKMPKVSGLQILNYFTDVEINFQIIFTTAYSEHAIEAFKMSAVDYILKPINPKRVIKAVDKAIQVIQNNNIYEELKNLKKVIKNLTVNTIALEVPGGVIFTEYDDIQYIEAEGMYSKVHLNKGKVELVSRPLKYFVEQLENNLFFYRPHRSYLVNLKYIKEMIQRKGNYIIMKSNTALPITKERKKEFIEVIQSRFQ